MVDFSKLDPCKTSVHVGSAIGGVGTIVAGALLLNPVGAAIGGTLIGCGSLATLVGGGTVLTGGTEVTDNNEGLNRAIEELTQTRTQFANDTERLVKIQEQYEKIIAEKNAIILEQNQLIAKLKKNGNSYKADNKKREALNKELKASCQQLEISIDTADNPAKVMEETVKIANQNLQTTDTLLADKASLTEGRIRQLLDQDKEVLGKIQAVASQCIEILNQAVKEKDEKKAILESTRNSQKATMKMWKNMKKGKKNAPSSRRSAKGI